MKVMKIRVVVTGIWLLIMSNDILAQNVLDRFSCFKDTRSEFIEHELKAPPSDDYCTRFPWNADETRIAYIKSGKDLGDVSVERLDGGPYRVKVNVNWYEAEEGVMLIQIMYLHWIRDGVKCTFDGGWKELYTYRITRGNLSPGSLIGPSEPLTSNGDFPVSVNLICRLDPDVNINWVRWHVTNTFNFGVAERVAETNDFSIKFEAYEFGDYQVNYEVFNTCINDWVSGTSKTISIKPTCYNDNSSNNEVSASLTGPQLVSYGNSTYEVKKDLQYSLNVTGIDDFSNHYTWNVEDGAEDIAFDGSSFKLLSGLGSCRINAVKKPGRGDCPTLDPIKVFVGGRDIVIEQTCAITLPEDFPKFGYDYDPERIEFHHFAARVESKRSITVMPGLTLDLGAELFLDLPPPVPDPEDPDKGMHYVEQKSFDEYGRPLAEARSYFDNTGKPLQSQYKNYADDVVLATATLYDAYGRAAINTLSAPVDAGTETTVKDECDEDQVIGEKMKFTYKPDFVKASDGSTYNYKHFDLTSENSPAPVSAAEGTLGWYYSANNNNTSNSKMKESFVANTQYPYSRILFHHDGSGRVKGTTRPGDAYKAGSGKMVTANEELVPASDSYLTKYLSIRSKDIGIPSIGANGDFFKTKTEDEAGKKSITYTDKAGKTIISLYFGSQNTPITTSYQFYDNAGRLIVSVSPNGVAQYNGNNFKQIDKTTYTYNHKGWLLSMEEPDAGITKYMYRKDGAIRFSQNAEQKETGKYSYTHYDRSGRPVESGEYLGTIIFGSTELTALLENTGSTGFTSVNGTYAFQTFTYYDEPAPEKPAGREQRFVHGAVSSSKNNQSTSYYSYDERGRMEWMVQDIPGLGMKTIDYRYGPVGAVQEVVYQRNDNSERFTHFYEYDVNGRLYRVYTTRDLLEYNKEGKLTNGSIAYDNKGHITTPGPLQLQATYSYYLHGPLKRIVYADGVQGIDYTYTADGALKGINDAAKDNDPGKDTNDVFGMTLEYYNGDYVNSNYTPTVTKNYPAKTEEQFGGLIKGASWHSPIEANTQFAYGYQYDDRYQFKSAQWGSTKTGAMIFNTTVSPYLEAIGSYDGNGNIGALERKDALGQRIARFNYNYTKNTNKLDNITTPVSEGNKTKDEVVFGYKYNKIGQLEEQDDAVSKTKTKMTYDVSGKLIAVKNKQDIVIATYGYDDRGFRISKTNYDKDGVPTFSTWYVRDATGNVITTYEDNLKDAAPAKPVEVPVYASGRIGLYKPEFGFTLYEVSDHLGNVRAVIGDKLNVEYLATMESERLTQESVKEEGDFVNVVPSPSPEYVNHTASTVTVNSKTETISNPNEVCRLNNKPLGVPDPKPVGTGIMLWVHPGDVLEAEVYVKYANFNADEKNLVAGLGSFLKTAFGGIPGPIDAPSLFNVVDEPGFAALPVWSKLEDDQPHAFLNYLLFDNNSTLQDFDFDQASSSAQITGDGLGQEHEKLTVRIPVLKEGFLYIYVSNQSNQNMDVYFDDLKVTHQYSDIVAGGDYYPFGLAIKDRQIQREFYRHGYQGQFSEKDEETGWNHFEAREYDPSIGRWTSTDPKSQFFSAYIGMGNNPISGVDPDGKWFWEARYIREARAIARHTGGTLEIFRDIGVASVDITNTSYNNTFGVSAYRFVKDGDHYQKMRDINVDFTEIMLAQSSGLSYVTWFLAKGDDYANGRGQFDRNGQAPDWVKAQANLLAPVSIVNASLVLRTETDIYGMNASSNFDKGQAFLDLASSFIPLIKGTVTILGKNVPKAVVAEVVVTTHGLADDFGAYDNLKK
jgi:RHS repeat-associated protein